MIYCAFIEHLWSIEMEQEPQNKLPVTEENYREVADNLARRIVDGWVADDSRRTRSSARSQATYEKEVLRVTEQYTTQFEATGQFFEE
jgi:hypothetical protein